MLRLKNISLESRIEDVELHIKQGECWHLLGNNGAGKSSLLGLMSGLLAPQKGEVLFNEHNIVDMSIAELAVYRCFLQQLPQSEFDISLRELLFFYTQRTDFPRQVEQALELNGLMHKPLKYLSGGQQQRFHLARCLSQVWHTIEQGQALVLLDEPSQHLDVKYQASLMRLLSTITKRGNIVVMSSHDINQSHQYASHIAWIKHNKIVSSGAVAEQMSTDKINHVFEHEFQQIDNPASPRAFFISEH